MVQITDIYNGYAKRFIRLNDLDNDHVDIQFRCIIEEIGELSKAMNQLGKEEQSNELADVLFTVFVLANLLNIDTDEFYIKVSENNLTKKNKSTYGKVI